MNRTILILAIVISGMLMQAQEYITDTVAVQPKRFITDAGKGFEAAISFGYNFNLGWDELQPWDELTVGMAIANAGYRFNKRLYAGAGVGYISIEGRESLIPLFVSGRLNLTKKKITPYVDFNIGYSISTKPDYESYGVTEKFGGGLFMNPSLGVNFNFTKNYGMDWSVGYLHQNKTFTSEVWEDGRDYGGEYVLQSIIVSIGFRF